MRVDPANRPRIVLALLVGLLVAAAVFAVIAALSDAGSGSQANEPPELDEYTAGRAVFVRAGCGDCHRLAAVGSRGRIGPDLDKRLASYTHEALVARIIDPYPDLDRGQTGIMPGDFGRRLTDAELDDLASFLLAASGEERDD